MPQTQTPAPAQPVINVNVPPAVKQGAATYWNDGEVLDPAPQPGPKPNALSVQTARDLTHKLLFAYIFPAYPSADGNEHFLLCTIKAMLGSEVLATFPLSAGVCSGTLTINKSPVAFGSAQTSAIGPAIVLSPINRLAIGLTAEPSPIAIVGMPVDLECDSFVVDVDKLVSVTGYRIYLGVLATRPETYH